MAGTIRGRVDCRIATGNFRNTSQAIFVNLYRFFAGLGGASAPPASWSIIASNFGKTSGVQGTGMNFYDEANDAKMNAFFVLKQAATAAKPWDQYTLFQWAYDGSNFGQDPGNPGACLSNYGVAASTAFGIGGNGNPWTGTTNNNGLDRKGAVAGTGPVWNTPSGGSGVVAWPRNNMPSGTTSTNREGCTLVAQANVTGTVRLHIVADDDSFAVATSGADDGQYTLHYSGLYVPRTGLTIAKPFVQIWSASAGAFLQTADFGRITGFAQEDGGVAQRDGTGVRAARFDRFQLGVNIFNTVAQPNLQFPSSSYDELPVNLLAWEAGHYGLIGEIDFLREVYNVATETRNAADDRIALGTTTVANVKVTMPWKPGQTPRSSVDRQGVNF